MDENKMIMKNIFLVFLTLTFLVNCYAQCAYNDFSNAPKELLRKRVKDNEPGFRYGNPCPVPAHL